VYNNSLSHNNYYLIYLLFYLNLFNIIRINKFYEVNEQEEELHKQLHLLFGKKTNDKKINDEYYKNDDAIITRAPAYHERFCYNIHVQYAISR
jgi:hypothetical protein